MVPSTDLPFVGLATSDVPPPASDPSPWASAGQVRASDPPGHGNGSVEDVPRRPAVVAEPVGFDTYVRRQSSALVRLAFLLTGDHHRAKDLVQATLTKVFPRWDTTVARGDPHAYVRTVMVHIAIGWRRRKWEAERPTAELPDRPGELDPVVAVDHRQRLRLALLRLPPRQRAAVVLRHYEDLSEARDRGAGLQRRHGCRARPPRASIACAYSSPMTDPERPPMDMNDLHAALNDLAGTTVDDPGLLAAVHHRVRRNRRRRVALTSGSALAVLGVALAAGEGGFSRGGQPIASGSSPSTSTTSTTTSTLPPTVAPVSGLPGTGACDPATALKPARAPRSSRGRGILRRGWGLPRERHDHRRRIRHADGHAGQQRRSRWDPDPERRSRPATRPTGASAEFSGIRTGAASYQLNQVAISFGGDTEATGSSGPGTAGPITARPGTAGPATAGSATATSGPGTGKDPQPGGGTILSWTGNPPAVGQAFDVSGTVTAVGSDTLTVTLVNSGGVGGTLTVSAAHAPPLATDGATAEFSGTRTGPSTYQLTHGTVRLVQNTAAGGTSGSAAGSTSGSAASGTSGSAAGGTSGATSGPANTAVDLSPGILSWTGSPPATGHAFDVSGTVTQVGSDTVTITLAPGSVSGTLTIGSVCLPPLAQRGASARVSGTRTGSDTYQVTQFSLSQSASSSDLPAALGTSG